MATTEMKTTSLEEWKTARAELLKEEKAATKLLSSLAEKRRNLPMLEVAEANDKIFITNDKQALSLSDLFDGRRQLIVYHHMPFNAQKEACTGCSFFSDHVPRDVALAHLHSRDTTFAETAPETPEDIQQFKERMGWTFPIYSLPRQSLESGPSKTTPVWHTDEGAFQLSCFFKDGDRVFYTWGTGSRGVESVLSTYALLDMTKLGRQDDKGFKHHDKY